MRPHSAHTAQRMYYIVSVIMIGWEPMISTSSQDAERFPITGTSCTGTWATCIQEHLLLTRPLALKCMFPLYKHHAQYFLQTPLLIGAIPP